MAGRQPRQEGTALTLDALFYLLELYWPFLAGALAIGLVAGWLSGARRRKS